MKKLRFAAAFFACFAAGSSVLAQEDPAAAIRDGKNIAMTSCIACHVVSPDQDIQPLAGVGASSFQDIANRPGVTRQALSASMISSVGHDPAKTGKLLPLAGISDAERLDVASYILSLRQQP